MDVVILGSGSPIPDPNRAGPSTLVRAGGHDLLVDAGRGVLMRLAGAGALPPGLAAVLLTHLHSDHVTDLNDVITMRWAMTPVPHPLPVVGPPGTERFVERTIEMLRDDIGYRRAHHADLDWDPDPQVTEVADGPALELGAVTVTAAPTSHRPVHPTVGYRVTHEGRSVVLAGDTIPCDGLDRLCAGADVLVHTVIRPSAVQAIPSPRLQDILDYHSSIEQAAQTATRGGVGTLVLTHPVPPPVPGTEHEWEDEARAHFDGEVVLAHDLLRVTLDDAGVTVHR